MKLWSSVKKELLIASRGFYFYVELLMAFILLFVLLLVVPEHFVNKDEEFLYLAIPDPAIRAAYIETFDDLDGQPEPVVFKIGKDEITTQLYESQDGHHKRHSLGRKIEMTGGHAHQRECHQYCGRHSHNYHTGAIRFRHLRTLLSAVLPAPRPARGWGWLRIGRRTAPPLPTGGLPTTQAPLTTTRVDLRSDPAAFTDAVADLPPLPTGDPAARPPDPGPRVTPTSAP